KETYEGKDATSTSLDATLKSDEAAIANAQAAINADKAAIETAKVQLSYCTINSPIDGKLGQLLIHQGNLVKANDTVSMVVINQVIPVYVVFSVPQQQLPDIKKYSDQGQLKTAAILPDGEKRDGTLSFLDNSVDQSTGTIQLKAIFQNQDKVLWPGQFVNVVLTLTQQPNVVVAPSQAVQSGQQGQFVYVVKPDMTVDTRPVVVGQGTNTEAVIQQGLKAGEIVVTNGQLRLSKGAKVEITGSSDSPISSDSHISRGESGGETTK
ncbi:MAG TPA: efflux RND transporter periplasmic adaptor subunit, partial [Blastocatellia bacterium]|nr:efflux RND transporter periplasmic adaptor subunit [Blastocatellia bacterium]